MVYYVVKACQQANIFDDIYINSEHDLAKKLADWLGVKFYQRSSDHGGSQCVMQNKSRQCQGTRCQTHDHYLYDFMTTVSPDLLIQVHTTSPLLKPETIKKFVEEMESKKYDSLFTVEEFQNRNVTGWETP